MSPTFSPISLGGIGKAVINSTTGSPTVNNNARAGKTIYQFNGSGSITVGTAGTAEILVVGGGGAGAAYSGGGGAGGVYYSANAILPAGNFTVTIGAGGNNGYEQGGVGTIPGNPGTPSSIGSGAIATALGGGAGGTSAITRYQTGFDGGSGGGASRGNTASGGVSLLSQGSAGGATNSSNTGSAAGGGGGYANVGQTPNDNNGYNSAGGNGYVTNINGSSVTYAGGGAGVGGANSNTRYASPGGNGGGGAAGQLSTTSATYYIGVAGTANSGGGGGANGFYSSGFAYGNGGQGGSGNCNSGDWLMAHFVQMNGNRCGQVIVVNNEILDNKSFPESEPIGIAFCKTLFGENTEWLQTSYNHNFRGHYAGSGMIYDEINDEFKYPSEEPTE